MDKSRATTVFRQIYRQLDAPLQRRCWRVLALSGSVSLVELAITAALSLLGIALAAPQTLVEAEAVHRMIDWWPALSPIIEDQRTLLLWLMITLCLALALKSLSLAYLTWRQAAFSQNVGVFFSVRYYGLLLRAPYLWHVRQDMTMLQTRLTWARFSADFLLAALQAMGQMLVACVLIGVVAATTPWAALFVCVCTGISASVTYMLAQRKVHELNEASMETEAGANRVAYPSLAGIREVKIYGQEKAFLRQFSMQRLGFAKVQTMLPVVYPAPAWILDLTGMLMLLAALLVMSSRGLSVATLTGQLTLLAAVTWRLLPTVNALVTSLLQVQQHMVYTEDAVRSIKTLEDELAASPLDAAPDSAAAAPKPCALNETLELRQVAFRYPDTPASRPDALHDINVRIPRGSMVGFIGSSGAGKSTVVGLLTGLLAPTAGQLLVDGAPLTPERRAGWLRAIGYVPQTPFLLNASIAANVAFSHWGEDADRGRIADCCRMAAMDFLADLPEGLDTVIGERGVRLSGGQVQRIAIARALYERPQLMLFDEATSALDGASEQAIQDTIESLGGSTTLVLVAHRLSTVKHCDRLFWLGNGTLLMQGTPDEVLPRYEAFLAEKNRH
ncbi:MAG: ABC transporter ATP-binding protein/permease [Desulfovibrio sp.]|nr:ABC transporter ATP-binding protein/permease [Desulfovibrio sp.]